MFQKTISIFHLMIMGSLILVFEHFIILLGLIINFLMPTTPNKLKILLRDDYQKKQSIAKKNKLEYYNNINNINNI